MKVQYGKLERTYAISYKWHIPSCEAVERVVLAVHGFGGSKESAAITQLAAALESERTSVLCFDLPAHGASEADEEHLTVEEAAADLLCMADFAERTYPQAKKAVFATSFGGFLALICAERFDGWRMVLRAPAVTMPRILLANVLRMTDEQFRQCGEVVCSFARPIRLSYACYTDMLSYADRVHRIDRAMLIVHGDADEVVPPDDIRGYAALHTDVCLKMIEGANHRFQAEGTLGQAIGFAKDYILSEE